MSGDDALDEGVWLDDLPQWFRAGRGEDYAEARRAAAERAHAASRADEDARARRRERRIGVER